MREAIGGTILLYIVLIFLFVYIAFMAIVINYGRVFRSKNSVVTIIEQYEGVGEDTRDALNREIISKQGYNGPICICWTKAPKGNVKYYTVKLKVKFAMPLIREDDYPTLDVTGQTSGIPALKEGKDDLVPECAEGFSQVPIAGSGSCY